MTTYTVHSAQTGELLAFGDAKQCAAQMGKTQAAFTMLVSNVVHGISKKYTVQKECVAAKSGRKRRKQSPPKWVREFPAKWDETCEPLRRAWEERQRHG